MITIIPEITMFRWHTSASLVLQFLTAAAVPLYAYRWGRLAWTAGLTEPIPQLCKWIIFAAWTEPITIFQADTDTNRQALKKPCLLTFMCTCSECEHCMHMLWLPAPKNMLVYVETGVFARICSRKSHFIIMEMDDEIALWCTSL